MILAFGAFELDEELYALRRRGRPVKLEPKVFDVTPQVHRIHHARERDLAFSNYANVFPVWDILFGTFQDPTRVRPADFGIENDTMPPLLWGQIAAPFAWRRFAARTAPQSS
jgi:sterol desaturase/sphingolipid hydroxylase (fatty acid hydroxylase superfamily)